MEELFLNRSWLTALLGVLALALVICSWAYYRVAAQTGKKVTLALIKLSVFAVLVWVLLEPNEKIEKPMKGYYKVILLHDTSKSMLEFGDENLKASDNLLSLLKEQQVWLNEVQEHFQIHQYQFGHQLQAHLGESDLSFEASQSHLGRSLERCLELHDPDQIAAIVVMSDGQVNLKSDPELLNKLPPVFFYALGREPIEPDLNIVQAEAKPSAYEDAPTKIHAEIQADRLVGKKAKARLLDPEGKEVWKESFKIQSDRHHIHFEIKPKFSGVQFYTLEVLLAEEGVEERTLANNQWVVKVDQKDGPFKVLYVSGRPNWEYKYIRRALEEDPMLELSALVRIAKGETKFEFRDKSVSSVNPLFKGLDKDKAEREVDFDEPVFLRLNISSEDEFSQGFPSSKAALFKYHALIIDDLESSFFSGDQLQLIKDFVQVRGGACLFLGGQETFSTGGYEQSTLSGMMPVYFDHRSSDEEEVGFELTREGSLTPWARVASEMDQDKLLRQRMPGFKVNHTFTKSKPGSSVIAKPSKGEGILMAVQDYGLGKSAILSIGDFWRWHMQPLVEDELLQHWRQTLRYLISDTPEQNEFKLTQEDTFRYKLLADIKDEDFEAFEVSDLKLIETMPDGSQNPLVLHRDPKAPSGWSMDREPTETGSYAYSLSFKQGDAEVELKDVIHQQVEHIETQWDAQALKELKTWVAQSSGQVLSQGDLSQLYDLIPKRDLTQVEVSYEPLWDKTYIWIPLVLLLCLEWGLRRRWGLS